MSALEQNLDQGRVSIERGGDPDLDILMNMSELFDEHGQVTLQVDPQREEVRDYQNMGYARIGQNRHGLGETWLGFQEGGFDAFKGSCDSDCLRDGADCRVSRWHAGAMRKDDNSHVHSYYEHIKIC